MLSTRSRTFSSVRMTLVSSETPPRAQYTWSGALIQISSMESSSSRGWSGPKPATASATMRTDSTWSCSWGSEPDSARD